MPTHSNTVVAERRLSCSSLIFPPFSPRLSFSYQKLPTHFFKLTVLKLDGSSFDVQVLETATVGELKQAVEGVFTCSPNEGQEISWSHVWGHFCLCYGGEKLINDKDYIRNFGIRDGDQLHFIRHVSINYKLTKKRSKGDNATCEELKTISWSGSNVCERKDEISNGYEYVDVEEGYIKRYQYEDGGDEEFIGHPQFKLAPFLKGWLSYSRLWFGGKAKSDDKVRPSRFSTQFLKLGSKLTVRPI